MPNRDADPVSFNRYRGSANLRMELPNREMICPITTREKSLVNSLSFIKTPFIHSVGM